MDISKRLKEVREQKGFSVASLSEKIGRDVSTIESWENGTISPGASDLIDLSKAYEMKMDEMIYSGVKAPEYNVEKGTYGSSRAKEEPVKKKKCKASFTKSERITLLIFPIMCTVLFLILGIFMHLWHPGWMVFLAVPVYYIIVIIFRYVGNDATDAVEEYMDEKN